MDEFTVEASEEDADRAGQLMDEAYEYASFEIFEWYKKNVDKFPNLSAPLFPFNLKGGYKIGKNYYDVH